MNYVNNEMLNKTFTDISGPDSTIRVSWSEVTEYTYALNINRTANLTIS